MGLNTKEPVNYLGQDISRSSVGEHKRWLGIFSLPGYFSPTSSDWSRACQVVIAGQPNEDCGMGEGKQERDRNGVAANTFASRRELDHAIRSSAEGAGGKIAGGLRTIGIGLTSACAIAGPVIADLILVYATDTHRVVTETEEKLTQLQGQRDAIIVQDMGRRHAREVQAILEDIRENPARVEAYMQQFETRSSESKK